MKNIQAAQRLQSSPQSQGGHGSGVLFQAADTLNFLFVKRSDTGDQPGTWCCLGGGAEPHETIDQAARREVREEAGYDEPYDLIHMARVQNNGYTFHNHLAVVPSEFEPQLNDEHTEYQWARKVPQPAHPGFMQAVHEFLERHNQAKV